MARSRNIKPGFFKDAKVVSCSYAARLLFQGLWCIADYKGRFKYEPLEVKMEIFPADDVDINKMMDELAEKKLIEFYTEHSGTTLVQVRGFEKHQNPHINEKQNRDKTPAPHLPSKMECLAKITELDTENSFLPQQVIDSLVVLREYSQNNTGVIGLIPDSLYTDSLIKNTLSETPKKPKKTKPEKTTEPFIYLFDMFWEAGLTKSKKKDSYPAFIKVLKTKKGTELEFTSFLVNDIKQRINNRQNGFEALLPTSYLNGERWNDDYSLGSVSGFDNGKIGSGKNYQTTTDAFNDKSLLDFDEPPGSTGDLEQDLLNDQQNRNH